MSEIKTPQDIQSDTKVKTGPFSKELFTHFKESSELIGDMITSRQIHKTEILEGEVVIGEQEGGYCSPALIIGGVDFTEWFEEKYHDWEKGGIPGEYIITVEKIE